MSAQEFTNENFDAEVINADVPVLVDFWAAWCGPCRMQGPIVEELAESYAGKNVKIGKLDVDAAPQVAQRFGVMSIPTLILFKDGKPVEQMVGVHDKTTLATKIDAHAN